MFNENQDEIYNHEAQFEAIADDVSKASRISHEANVSVVEKPATMNVSSALAVFLIVTLVSALVIWIFYAYRNPHTTSGQILIKVSGVIVLDSF